MKRSVLALFAILSCGLTISAQAASDTDVTIIKAESVIIEENKITIIASAGISMIVLVNGTDKNSGQTEFLGQPAMWINVRADKATFVITRPKEDPEGAWTKTLQAASELKDGKEIGRIGYYQPKVTLEKSVVTGIRGAAFLYPKSK